MSRSLPQNSGQEFAAGITTLGVQIPAAKLAWGFNEGSVPRPGEDSIWRDLPGFEGLVEVGYEIAGVFDADR